ncbi:unnamed protein product [Blepharisma stoltei]|uniref:Uncharacterized protein n=1 Tax=Blepharisma stoltei TaxID=1481888 RepID=A0AAU9IHY2_9CILI|nr:unnamed protein product [Blepharisma stoltei]
MKLNSSDIKGIRELFRLRAGWNHTNACQYIRHQANSMECEYCRWHNQDVKHLIEDAPNSTIKELIYWSNWKT